MFKITLPGISTCIDKYGHSFLLLANAFKLEINCCFIFDLLTKPEPLTFACQKRGGRGYFKFCNSNLAFCYVDGFRFQIPAFGKQKTVSVQCYVTHVTLIANPETYHPYHFFLNLDLLIFEVIWY